MALELGGLFAAPVLKVAFDHIVSVIDGQIILRKNFEKDLKHMKRSLERVEAVLDHAGKNSITDTSTCLWLQDLKDAMYAISDMIDEFEADTQGFAQLSTREVCVPHVDALP
jgi:enamine deaminase RidA (YjgF/YER057c/UK114 family)